MKKPMRECTGKEICMEWLYHLGVPEEQIEDLAAHSANTIPCMMPYITAFFMPALRGIGLMWCRKGPSIRPLLGQFAETAPVTPSLPPEYSMRDWHGGSVHSAGYRPGRPGRCGAACMTCGIC